MADFKTAYKVVKGHEGGYANDKDDTGGETYKGISRKNFPTWKGWAIIDGYKGKPGGFEFLLDTDMRLDALVLSFYKTNFWDELNLDHVTNQPIATELFDTGVNMGTGVSALFLQQSLNVLNLNGAAYQDIEEDRKLGPLTIGLLNNHKKPNNVLKVLNALQGAKYIAIARANPRQEKFMNSWLSRVQF